MNTVSESTRRRNRIVLLGVAALFVVPILIALALNLAGWRPTGSKAYGVLIDPPRQVETASVALADGRAFDWRDKEWHWTLVALPGANCAQRCQAALADVLRMRATLGRNAERLRVLYLGPMLPADQLAALIPLQQGSDSSNAFGAWRAKGDDALALTLVDPGGFAMMHYAEDYDVGGVRRDLPKVIK